VNVCGAGLIEALPPKKVDELSVVVLEAAAVLAVECVAGWASRTTKPKAAKALRATAPIE
jgi:hypothetical protein